MKKLLFLITIAFAFSLFSCQKEGVYTPSEKIKRISVLYNSKKVLSQEWSWNNKILNKIEYFYLNTGGLAYSSTFKYDGNRITDIQDSDGYFTKFSYNGNLYDKVDYYNSKSELRISLKFSYSGKKVSSIEGQFYSSKKSSSEKFNESYLATLIPELRLSEEQMMQLQAKGGGVSIIKWNFEFNGDNLSKLEIQDDGKIVTNSFEEYDKNINPYYHHVEVINTPFILFLSKNNVVRQTNRDDKGNSTLVDYAYIYSGKTPTEVQRKANTNGSVTISTTYYEYVK